jgi:hypothetical protein
MWRENMRRYQIYFFFPELSLTLNTKLRSTGVERYTPKFLKNWETQLFQKSLGIR